MGGIVLENIRKDQTNPSDPVIGTFNFDSNAFYQKLGVAATADQQDYEALLNDPNFAYKSAGDLQNKVKGLNYCTASTAGDISTLQTIADTVKQLVYAIDFTGIVSNEDYINSLVGPGGVIDGTARLVFFSMFFTLLSVFSTVGAVRALSPLLGGDTEIAGLTHLI